jgi:hypothetical protein
MFGWAILDVAVGMVFLYLLLSVICSAIFDLLETWLNHRAQGLEAGLRELLQDAQGIGLTKKIFEHPLVNCLFPGKYNPLDHKNLPGFIPAANFAMALLDVSASPETLPPGVELPEGVRRTIDTFRQDAATARANVEAWFNACMSNVAAAYKQRAQAMTFGIGLAVALATNMDSITIARGLASNAALRNSVVAAAGAYLSQNPNGPPSADPAAKEAQLREYLGTVSAIGLPIGWQDRDGKKFESVTGRIPDGFADWIFKIIGCLLTAGAISLGAPFWYDLLAKLAKARSMLTQATKPATP